MVSVVKVVLAVVMVATAALLVVMGEVTVVAAVADKELEYVAAVTALAAVLVLSGPVPHAHSHQLAQEAHNDFVYPN